MSPHQLHTDLYQTTKKAIRTIGYIPKRSLYRTLAYKLIQEVIPAKDYHRLKNRLVRFDLENKDRL